MLTKMEDQGGYFIGSYDSRSLHSKNLQLKTTRLRLCWFVDGPPFVVLFVKDWSEIGIQGRGNFAVRVYRVSLTSSHEVSWI